MLNRTARAKYGLGSWEGRAVGRWPRGDGRDGAEGRHEADLDSKGEGRGRPGLLYPPLDVRGEPSRESPPIARTLRFAIALAEPSFSSAISTLRKTSTSVPVGTVPGILMLNRPPLSIRMPGWMPAEISRVWPSGQSLIVWLSRVSETSGTSILSLARPDLARGEDPGRVERPDVVRRQSSIAASSVSPS